MVHKIIYKTILLILIVFILLNFLLVFTPETGFDALWYHLTLPKLWLLKHQWYFPGGLMYYSAMPRLGELIFTPLISLFGSGGPKFIQFSSGLISSFLIYKIILQQTNKKYLSLFGVCAFYFSYLVSWQSGSAYVDLIRTAIELGALYFAINKKYFYTAILLGLAVGVKWQALVSVVIFSSIFSWTIFPVSLLVASPWFALAYLYTKNPIFPVFSNILPDTIVKSPSELISRILLLPYHLTLPADDFISPIIGIVFLISLLAWLKNKNNFFAQVGIIGMMSVQIMNPPSARFSLVYFPALIISTLIFLDSNKININILGSIILLSGIIVLSLRILTFEKYLPFLTGKQTAIQYLTAMASKMPDTFIDEDGFVANSLSPQSRYLIDHLHNLYYFPYNFDHTSWTKNYNSYDYLITNSTPPNNINTTLLVHQNNIGIKIYKIN